MSGQTGLIVLGYPGIGKSTVCKKLYNTIDFESSNFDLDGDKYDGWEAIYVAQAVSLAKQGFRVLISCHDRVQDILALYNQQNFRVVAIAPTIELKNLWVSKLHDRYFEKENLKNLGISKSHNQYFEKESLKNKKAYERALEHYSDDITKLMSNPAWSHVYIYDMNYELNYMILHLYHMFGCTKNDQCAYCI
jgi:tRNA uridine 5-carbamoylmethylation protein Kti12